MPRGSWLRRQVDPPPWWPPGKDAARIVNWAMDHIAYTVTPVTSDGTSGPPLNLRGLFEQFLKEVA